MLKVLGFYVVFEKTKERKLLLIQVSDRKEKNKLDIIKKYVKKGSVIYTDKFKSYKNLEGELNSNYFTVNNSVNYKDTMTSVDTNTIERTWNGAKMSIKKRNRCKGKIISYLLKFKWRLILSFMDFFFRQRSNMSF